MKIELPDEQSQKKCVDQGIYVQNYHYRVDYWVKNVIMCFKCNQFDHKSDTCQKDQKCAKCSQQHQTKDCAINKNNYTCPNCGGCHASWSKSCREYMSKYVSINNQNNEWSAIVKN